MDLPILAATALGLAVASVAGSMDRGAAPHKAEGPAALVGQHLYATEDPIPRWGEPVRAEDFAVEDMGRVARVVTGPDGRPQGLVVEVGGLWGYGAQEVRLGMERVHLLRAADGGDRLVVDLSVSGAEPSPDGEPQFDL
ncbi:hypothetical protein Rumeso_01888 [Rubellimicrobium mesophilum DSM 19309]|uniref:PRC-barrel domain-containing protein n=1 Tax=Rubellimicrobium mesophilum DSM 19309 TaxID=442562 RepID=A0A017HPQ0_9RHOB|nr:hypothetical protein [Rubellimicrobium mesophilum]EYD76467.1 hypothetical protein Rumeso_01888 [Rubellimicrobium mesophilum DSM 19309]